MITVTRPRLEILSRFDRGDCKRKDWAEGVGFSRRGLLLLGFGSLAVFYEVFIISSAILCWALLFTRNTNDGFLPGGPSWEDGGGKWEKEGQKGIHLAVLMPSRYAETISATQLLSKPMTGRLRFMRGICFGAKSRAVRLAGLETAPVRNPRVTNVSLESHAIEPRSSMLRKCCQSSSPSPPAVRASTRRLRSETPFKSWPCFWFPFAFSRSRLSTFLPLFLFSLLQIRLSLLLLHILALLHPIKSFIPLF